MVNLLSRVEGGRTRDFTVFLGIPGDRVRDGSSRDPE